MTENLSLYAIETDLAQLLDLREQAEAEGETPKTLAVIDKQIAEYFAKEVKKVNGICNAIHAYEAAATEAFLEGERLHARHKNLQGRADAIKKATLRAMQDHGVKVLETPQNKIQRVGNGGLQLLEVTLEVPFKYQMVEVKVSREVWEAIKNAFEDVSGFSAEVDAPTPNNSAIREALKRGEIVPGAYLKDRGEHLKIS